MKIVTIYFLSRVSRFLFLMILFPLIQACSNAEIGQELSKSFDSSGNQESVGNIDTKISNISISELTKTEEKGTSSSIRSINQKKNKVRSFASKKAANSSLNLEKKTIFIPQPYRITIKLSATNPSAPAEAVTKALRTAGVEFEVEMIQLIDNLSSSKESRAGRSKR